jgi:hypothetical protein
MVPVTTKPYLNSAIFIILQQGIPAFNLLIKEKIDKHITYCSNRTKDVPTSALPDNSTDKLQRTLFLKLGSHYNLPIPAYSNPTVPFRVLRSFALGLGVSQIKEDFYNGKSSGI